MTKLDLRKAVSFSCKEGYVLKLRGRLCAKVPRKDMR
jgi:hypothetical protein